MFIKLFQLKTDAIKIYLPSLTWSMGPSGTGIGAEAAIETVNDIVNWNLFYQNSCQL